MASQEVKQWLVEYACHKRMTAVLYELGHRPGGVQKGTSPRQIDNLLRLIYTEGQGVHHLMEVRLALLYLHTVRDSGDIKQYGTVLEVVTELYNAISTKLPYKLFTKIISDLKILVLFDMLKNEDKMVIARLNSYFPRSGLSHPFAKKEVQKELCLAEQQFRKFFLHLAVSVKARDEYLKTRFETEFGTDFVRVLRDLLGRFIEKVEDVMPPTAIDRIMQSPHIAARLSQEGVAQAELLLGAVKGKKSFTETNVRELLQQLNDKSRPKQSQSCREQGLHRGRILNCNSSPKDKKYRRKGEEHQVTLSESASRSDQDTLSSGGSRSDRAPTSPSQGVFDGQITVPHSPVKSPDILGSGCDDLILVSDQSPDITACLKVSSELRAEQRKPLSRHKRSAQASKPSPAKRKKCHEAVRGRPSDPAPNKENFEVICISSSEELEEAKEKPCATESNSTDDVVVARANTLTQGSSSGESNKSVSLLTHKPSYTLKKPSCQISLQPETRPRVNFARPPIRQCPQGLHQSEDVSVSSGGVGHQSEEVSVSSSGVGHQCEEVSVSSSGVGHQSEEVSVSSSGVGHQSEEVSVSSGGVGHQSEEVSVSSDGVGRAGLPETDSYDVLLPGLVKTGIRTDIVCPIDTDSSCDSFETCHGEESFVDCALLGESQGSTPGSSNRVKVPYITASGQDAANQSFHIKDSEYVSDSGEEEEEDDLSAVPSSYSFNQYAVISGPVSTLVRMSLPDIEKHGGRPAGTTSPCIIKLYRTKALDIIDRRTGQHKMYC